MFKFSESTKRKLGNAIVYIAYHKWEYYKNSTVYI